jgi:putative sigma-54 modulation protein
MNVNISGHHVEITDSLRDFVIGKLKRLERHFDHLIDTDVILHVEKIRHRAEATLHVSGGNLFADAEEDDMYKAIDEMTAKLDKQVRKFKERLTDHHPKKAQKADLHVADQD